MALFFAITDPMSAIGVARSQRMTYPYTNAWSSRSMAGRISFNMVWSSVHRWERATPMALFLSIAHPMSAIGVARSQQKT